MEKASIEITQGSDRNFGVVIAGALAIIFSYFSYKAGSVIWWGFGACTALLVIAIVKPSWLRVPNFLWFRLGILLGSIIGPIVMALVYVTTVAPIGILLRLRGKDVLNLKLESSAETYWIKRETQPDTMKNQF